MVFTDRDDIPRTWGIREVIAQFLTLRDEVLVARSTAALNAATTKLQRAEAVKAVVLDKDTAVRLITESADRAAADAAISETFSLDEEQAHYVTSLALYRLTKADVLDAQREVDQLTAEIERLRALIDSEDLRAEELDKELEESINVFVRDGRYDRKTRIDHDAKPTSVVASDGDEPRLSEAGMEVVRDMRDEPVTMLRTFDGINREPQYLPSRFPVAPLAGSDGIAAGFSVTIPSHNPIEFLKLTRALLANPDLTTDEMMEIMPGPDWGVGASVINSKKAIASYFDNGTGKLTARSTFENIDGDVVLKEIAPTGSGLRKTLGQIRDKIRAGEITTLSGAEDHSDMDKGTHVVFTLRRGKKYEDAVAELYSKTSLEDTYSVNLSLIHI